MTHKVRFVLVNTTHPGNIGAAARAMKTMGQSELYLVSPKDFPSAKADALAAGAKDVLAQATVVDDLASAIVDCQLVLATSARCREMPLPEVSPRAALAQLMVLSTSASAAIVFGRESSGLSNAELQKCHQQVVIPSHPDYPSLNLGAAVQVMAYELRVAQLACEQPVPSKKTHDVLATQAQMEGFYQHLQHVLETLQFYDPSNPKRLLQRLRRLFNRSHMEVTELNILRGILSSMTKQMDRKVNR